MEENELQDELTSIRNLMERSSKFISLSGLSGILAGIYALGGSAAAYWLYLKTFDSQETSAFGQFARIINLGVNFLEIAAVVLLLSIITALILSSRKAKRLRQSIWSKTSRLILFYFGVPLITGGLVIAILLNYGQLVFVVPAMLIFYGLSLLSASNFTFSDVKYLGLCEIALGLIAACLPGYGLLFWAIGFGVLHIIYGTIMHFKYDR